MIKQRPCHHRTIWQRGALSDSIAEDILLIEDLTWQIIKSDVSTNDDEFPAPMSTDGDISDTPLTRSEGLLGLTPSYLLRALENYLRISQDT